MATPDERYEYPHQAQVLEVSDAVPNVRWVSGNQVGMLVLWNHLLLREVLERLERLEQR